MAYVHTQMVKYFLLVTLTLGLYSVARLEFFLWHVTPLSQRGLWEILWAFVVGMRFDGAAVAYLSMPPLLLSLLPWGRLPLSGRQQNLGQWAVFVGWIVWNQLELTGSTGRSIQKSGKSQDEWVSRLRSADREGVFRGYYEPEESGERAVARKRYLAPASRLSEQEVAVLMKNVLESSSSLLARARGVFSGLEQGAERYGQCG